MDPTLEKKNFSTAENERRLGLLAKSMECRPCTFARGAKRAKGKVLWVEFEGIREGKGRFTLQVQGKSGAVVTVDYHEAEVKLF